MSAPSEMALEIGVAEEDEREPWQRYGWILWGVWLVFLVFPLTAITVSTESWLLRGLGYAATAAFAGGYLAMTRRLDVREAGGWSEWGFLALASIPLGLSLLIGVNALGYTPFLASYAAFAFRRPLAWFVEVGLFALAAVIATTSGNPGDWAWFLFVLFAVSIGTSMGRLMADRGAEYGQTQRELAISAERERVARDVHDVLGHSLTVVTLKAQLAERLVDTDPERAKQELVDLQQLSREALAEIRATVGGLRAARLDDELGRAESALCAAGIRPELDDDPQVVDPARRTVVAWALRESVTNVVRHSRAQVCRVELGPHSLVVSDDGRGLRGSRQGNGLRGLAERIEGAGGRLSVGPGDDGRGTRVEVRW